MNKLLFSLRKKVAQALYPGSKNAMSLPSQFLKYGSRGEAMYPHWSDVQLSDQDHYTGYGYGSIVRRAVLTARVASEHIRTESGQKDAIHPYLQTISDSPSFTDFQFWSTISTYLDLEGVFYLMAIRNFEADRKGRIKEFKLLNPYEVRRVVNYSNKGLQIGGYIENKGGYTREIPKEMIIDIRNLNPFADNVPYGITDAAKEAQFTLKTKGDYTRQAIKHNINAPGILSTDVAMEEEEFKNFMNRVQKHTKGEPIYGNGSGAVKWEGMQNELSKAALKDINDIERAELLSTYGTSKTIMGIEESGTTRETAKVQKDLLLELHVLPQVQIIIDALNQDFRNNSPDFKTSKLLIVVDNPLGTDYDAKLKDVEVKTGEFDLYSTIVNRGVDNKTAAAYVHGEVPLEDLKIEKVELPDPNDPNGDIGRDKDKKKKESIVVVNQVEIQSLIDSQASSLQNAVIRIEEQLLFNALARIPKKIKNAVDLREKDVITQQEQTNAEEELKLILLGFYNVIVNVQGHTIMRQRMSEFAMSGLFTFDRHVEQVAKLLSGKASQSHIETVVKEIYTTAYEAAKEGKSLDQIERLLKEKYTKEISTNRAKALARSETNRAFTTAQYEADLQFVKQNDLGTRAYKQWITRSDKPCAFCESLAKEPPILLTVNFRSKGETIEVDGKTLSLNYLDLEAGNAHTNCNCAYKLIVKED